jgi:hypothetical protein
MQEVTRRSNDYYLEDVESGNPAAEAHYLCLPKGDLTPLSKGARLIHYIIRHCYPKTVDSFP